MEEFESSIKKNDKIYEARNEAMKALESLKEDKQSDMLLATCLKCDYSSPKIADYYHKKE